MFQVHVDIQWLSKNFRTDLIFPKPRMLVASGKKSKPLSVSEQNTLSVVDSKRASIRKRYNRYVPERASWMKRRMNVFSMNAE